MGRKEERKSHNYELFSYRSFGFMFAALFQAHVLGHLQVHAGKTQPCSNSLMNEIHLKSTTTTSTRRDVDMTPIKLGVVLNQQRGRLACGHTTIPENSTVFSIADCVGIAPAGPRPNGQSVQTVCLLAMRGISV
jgi:hypothetical protein